MEITLRRRTALGAAGALAALAALPSCGSGSGSEGSAGGKAVLDFPAFVWGEANNKPWFEGLKAQYEAENANYSITATNVPFATYHDDMYTRMVTKHAPDIVLPYDPQIVQWADAGLLTPLNPYLDQAGIDVGKLIPTNQLAVVDGKVYGVVQQSNPRVLVYNRDLFKRAGAGEPTSYDAYKAALSSIAKLGGGLYGYAFDTASDTANATYLDIMPVVAGFGGAFVRDGKPTASSAETVAALAFLKDAYDSKQVPRGSTTDTYREAFLAQKVASLTIGPYIMSVAKSSAPATFKNLNAVPLPFPGHSTISVNVFMSIPSSSKNKDAAAKFITTMLTDKWQANVTSMINALPARTDQVPKSFVTERPWFQAVVDSSRTAVSYAPQGLNEKSSKGLDIITKAFQRMLFSGVSAQDTGAAIDEQLAQLTGK